MFKPQIRQEGFHLDIGLGRTSSASPPTTNNATSKEQLDFSDTLAELMTSSTPNRDDEYETYRTTTHNIFDVGVHLNNNNNSYAQHNGSVSSFGSASTNHAAFPSSFTRADSFHHAPHGGSYHHESDSPIPLPAHFNSTLPALSSTMRYDPLPLPNNGNTNQQRFFEREEDNRKEERDVVMDAHSPILGTKSTLRKRRSNKDTAEDEPRVGSPASPHPAQTQRQTNRSRSRPPSASAGPGPTRTSRTRRTGSVSGPVPNLNNAGTAASPPPSSSGPFPRLGRRSTSVLSGARSPIDPALGNGNTNGSVQVKRSASVLGRSGTGTASRRAGSFSLGAGAASDVVNMFGVPHSSSGKLMDDLLDEETSASSRRSASLQRPGTGVSTSARERSVDGDWGSESYESPHPYSPFAFDLTSSPNNTNTNHDAHRVGGNILPPLHHGALPPLGAPGTSGVDNTGLPPLHHTTDQWGLSLGSFGSSSHNQNHNHNHTNQNAYDNHGLSLSIENGASGGVNIGSLSMHSPITSHLHPSHHDIFPLHNNHNNHGHGHGQHYSLTGLSTAHLEREREMREREEREREREGMFGAAGGHALGLFASTTGHVLPAPPTPASAVDPPASTPGAAGVVTRSKSSTTTSSTRAARASTKDVTNARSRGDSSSPVADKTSPSAGGGDKQTLLASEKRRRRRESHNAVERRRRDNINERIGELATLIPEGMLEGSTGGPTSPGDDLDGPGAGNKKDEDGDGGVVKANKGMILRKSVEYIRYLQQIVTAQNARNADLESQLKAYRGNDSPSTHSSHSNSHHSSYNASRMNDATFNPTSPHGESMMLHDEFGTGGEFGGAHLNSHPWGMGLWSANGANGANGSASGSTNANTANGGGLMGMGSGMMNFGGLASMPENEDEHEHEHMMDHDDAIGGKEEDSPRDSDASRSPDSGAVETQRGRRGRDGRVRSSSVVKDVDEKREKHADDEHGEETKVKVDEDDDAMQT